jgi:hypothetical protein
MFRPKGPPLSADCMICGAKMGLTIVEPGHHRTVYTYCRFRPKSPVVPG